MIRASSSLKRLHIYSNIPMFWGLDVNIWILWEHDSEHNTANSFQFRSVDQSCPTLATSWIAALQASLSITSSQSLLKLMSIESVMPSNHFILFCPDLFPPSIFPSIRVFSNESVLHIRWPKYWSSASASVLLMNIQEWFPLG